VLITPGGAVGQAADEIAFSDGMAATPDNSTLIIAESFGGRPTAYDIVTDGRVSNGACGRGVQRRDLSPHRGRPLESGLDRRQAPRTAG
jgi:sugar lactone lactonase YvrE